MTEEEFKLELSKIYSELLKDQDKLDSDFEKAWNDNIDKLYED